jgi:hypothetical protein
MSIQQAKEVVDTNNLSITVAEKYLKLYVANIDWSEHIASLWKNSTNKFKNEQDAKNYVKRAIACATLLPFLEKTPIPEQPKNLLFWCTGWKQFDQHDWFSMYLDVLKEDIKISENRSSVISIGVIDPIDISPITRQAFNWIYGKAEDLENLENVDIPDLKTKFANLVKAYGGAVICNVFINHKLYVDKVFNWRSGYFFEKQIHKVYNIDQIVKIKSAELLKTNKKYISNLGEKNAKQYSF